MYRPPTSTPISSDKQQSVSSNPIHSQTTQNFSRKKKSLTSQFSLVKDHLKPPPAFLRLPIMLRIKTLSNPRSICRSTHCISFLRNGPKSTYRFIHSGRSMVSSCWRPMWRDVGMAVGSFIRRPMLEMIRGQKPELSRGMKVRSSVKKMCDGCRVS